MLCTSLGNSKVSDNVTAVVDWCGPTNFCVMDKQFKESEIREKVQEVQIYNTKYSFPSKYLGQNLSEVSNLCKQADPITYITSECSLFLIQHGTLDSIIPTQQSIDLAAAIIKKIGQDLHYLTEQATGAYQLLYLTEHATVDFYLGLLKIWRKCLHF